MNSCFILIRWQEILDKVKLLLQFFLQDDRNNISIACVCDKRKVSISLRDAISDVETKQCAVQVY